LNIDETGKTKQVQLGLLDKNTLLKFRQ